MSRRSRYAELQVTSQFSFLHGASSCEELFAQAARLGIEALGIVDRNSLAGIVRAHEAARATGVRLVVSCRLDLACGMSVLVYPTDRATYARLCRLLSLGKSRAGKGKCHLDWADLASHGDGLIAILVPDEADEDCALRRLRLRRLHAAFGDRAYLRRRAKLEPVVYPRPELERVLCKTLGVPLFQEQAMRVAIECAGFSPGEADMLRKSMATFKFTGGVSAFRDKLVDGVVANGYARDFAEQTFRQLEGFGSYGFPESHAASFALIGYASAWLKCHHPEVFCAALLNAQPMGFYAPAQIVRDARDHGVEVRPICVNASHWDCTLEEAEGGQLAVRLGLRRVKGLGNGHGAALVAARDRPFGTAEDLWRRVPVPPAALVQLAEADAFRPSLGLGRREALWALKPLRDRPLPVFVAASEQEEASQPEIDEPAVTLDAMSAGREVVEDYLRTGLSLCAHPVAFLRDGLARRRMIPCRAAEAARNGTWIEVAGLVLVRQRPGSARGVMFVTLEDETGIANVVVWPKVFEAHRRIVLTARMLAVRGRIPREGDVVHLVAHRLTDLSGALATIGRPENAPAPRDIYIRDLHLDTIRVKTRDFR